MLSLVLSQVDFLDLLNEITSASIESAQIFLFYSAQLDFYHQLIGVNISDSSYLDLLCFPPERNCDAIASLIFNHTL